MSPDDDDRERGLHEGANRPADEPGEGGPIAPPEEQADDQPRGSDELRRELGPGDGDDPPPVTGDEPPPR